MQNFLTDKFLGKYEDFPAHMNELGKFVYLRTYSRFLDDLGRRETWKETCIRATNFNVWLAYKHFVKLGFTPDEKALKREAELLFDSMFNLKQFLSGRTLWVGGVDNGVAEKYGLANFNCSFLNIRKWADFPEQFYLLLVGTGVGFKHIKAFSKELEPIRTNTKLINNEYVPLPKSMRSEHTIVTYKDDRALISVGDSKEGWVESLRIYFSILTKPEYEHITTIEIDYDSVRQKGERLRTFGGTASGPEPLMEMFEGIDKVLKNKIDASLAPIETDSKGYGKVRAIHVLDIGNLIGANVVVGGVRRTAEIFLFDADDYEVMFAKYGINGFWSESMFARHEQIEKHMKALGIPVPGWFAEIGKRKYVVYYGKERQYFDTKEEADKFALTVESPFIDYPVNPGRTGINHRRMSNNSMTFMEKPKKEMLDLVFLLIQAEGEPGFINIEAAARRRLAARGIHNPSKEMLVETMVNIGLNPCAEILLWSRGVCNLTTVNLMQFIDYETMDFDYKALEAAQRLSARAAMRMTLIELESTTSDDVKKAWNVIQQRDRLLGTSLTGVKDAMDVLGFDKRKEDVISNWLKCIAREEADNYAKTLQVNAPLLVTTVKPEGTLSQVAGGVSSGLHWSHSPFYIRRIRINSTDALVKVAIKLGWSVNPEVGTPGGTHEERMKNARTLVIDFPIASGAKCTKDDVSAAEQMENYFRYQHNYTEHNASNTITVKPDEWDGVCDIIYEKWDEFVGVSFLSHDGGTYQLAPYEAVNKERYEELKAAMKPFDYELLAEYETTGESDLDGAEACESGICPVR